MKKKCVNMFIYNLLLDLNSFFNLNLISELDSAVKWQVHFQDPATPIMEGLIDLHHHIFFFLIVILTFVLWLMVSTLIYFHWYPEYIIDLLKTNTKYLLKAIALNKINHSYVLEIVWTLIPSVILIAIAIPSFALLYAMDEVVAPAITLKVIGHQWYWSYEYSDYVMQFAARKGGFYSLKFDSFMIPEDELVKGQLRLLEVDNRVILPTKTHIRFIITAADVLHSWAIPSLGVKMDAVPGRLNQASAFIKRPGIYFGQCSEICGINHGFMPIVIEAVSLPKYVAWVNEKYNAIPDIKKVCTSGKCAL